MRGLVRAAALVAALVAGAVGPARAEIEVSVYGGSQAARNSTVEGRYSDGSRFRFPARWEGRSLEGAPYWGVRAVWWPEGVWGFGLDFAHAKLYASDRTLARSGFDRLEFTDGLNVLTAIALRRLPLGPSLSAGGRLVPYVGGGIGVVIPHVELIPPVGRGRPFDYEFGGPALQAQAGIAYAITDRLSIFGEYKANWVALRTRLAGRGRFETDVFIDALNVGVTWRF